MKKNFIIIALIIMILLLLLDRCSLIPSWAFGRAEQHTQTQEALNDTVLTWRDKDNIQHAKIQVITTPRPNDFLKIKSKDSMIVQLQNKVKEMRKNLKRSGSLTLFNTNTTIRNTSENRIIINDSVRRNDSQVVYPEYLTNFNLDNWVMGTTRSRKDSTTIKLKIRNAYTVVIGEERRSLWKKPKCFVEVYNKNPFAQTQSLRTYQVSRPRKRGRGSNLLIC